MKAVILLLLLVGCGSASSSRSAEPTSVVIETEPWLVHADQASGHTFFLPGRSTVSITQHQAGDEAADHGEPWPWGTTVLAIVWAAALAGLWIWRKRQPRGPDDPPGPLSGP